MSYADTNSEPAAGGNGAGPKWSSGPLDAGRSLRPGIQGRHRGRTARLAALPPNWDRYAAPRIDPAIIAAATKFVRALPENIAYRPRVVPDVHRQLAVRVASRPTRFLNWSSRARGRSAICSGTWRQAWRRKTPSEPASRSGRRSHPVVHERNVRMSNAPVRPARKSTPRKTSFVA